MSSLMLIGPQFRKQKLRRRWEERKEKKKKNKRKRERKTGRKKTMPQLVLVLRGRPREKSNFRFKGGVGGWMSMRV